MNKFIFERNGVLANINLLNTNIAELTYEEMSDKKEDEIKELVYALLDAADEIFGNDIVDTNIALVDEHDCFIWGFIIESEGEDMFSYRLLDWRHDGHLFRYVEEDDE